MTGPKPSKKSYQRGRDAVTGKFITLEEAKSKPQTTVIETVKLTKGDKKQS